MGSCLDSDFVVYYSKYLAHDCAVEALSECLCSLRLEIGETECKRLKPKVRTYLSHLQEIGRDHSTVSPRHMVPILGYHGCMRRSALATAALMRPFFVKKTSFRLQSMPQPTTSPPVKLSVITRPTERIVPSSEWYASELRDQPMKLS